jgi:hypothetical protein
LKRDRTIALRAASALTPKPAPYPMPNKIPTATKSSILPVSVLFKPDVFPAVRPAAFECVPEKHQHDWKRQRCLDTVEFLMRSNSRRVNKGNKNNF